MASVLFKLLFWDLIALNVVRQAGLLPTLGMLGEESEAQGRASKPCLCS